MAAETLTHIIDQLNHLDQTELEYLSQVIDTRLNLHATPVNSERTIKPSAFYQALKESGLVNRITATPIQNRDFQPISISGDAIANTIIEERR